MHSVKYVGWSKGEALALLVTPGPPYVPQLKTVVVIQGVHYLVAVIESALLPSEPQGPEQDWLITVKLAKV
jgi:hypothetical protein